MGPLVSQPESFAKKSAYQYEKNPDYEPMIDIEGNRDDHDIVSWDMAPGDLIAFHAMTLHGSGRQSPPGRAPARIRGTVHRSRCDVRPADRHQPGHFSTRI